MKQVNLHVQKKVWKGMAANYSDGCRKLVAAKRAICFKYWLFSCN